MIAHTNFLHGWTGVFIGVTAISATAAEQIAVNNSQTLLTVLGEIIVAIISGFCLIKVAQLKTHINSRMDELLNLTRAAARAEGVVQGMAQQKQDQKDEDSK